MANSKLNNAKTAKKDEFYTQIEDIENELRHYRDQFKGKVVLCNCDDPRISNFTKYFVLNFEFLGLKRLICTCYKNNEPDIFSTNESEQAIYTIYEGDKNGNRVVDAEEFQIIPLKGDGDFRSAECIELLKQADIVVTNPPFSLFREYIAQLIEYDKKFLIMGNMNALHYSEVFPLIQHNKVWLGYNANKTMRFALPDHYDKWNEIINGVKYGKVPAITWFTNLDTKTRHQEMILFKRYNPEDYPTYENFNAINVNKVTDIPCDYDGYMGVPDTFLIEYNPDQFEIIGLGCGNLAKVIGITKNYRGRTDVAYVENGEHKCPYSRIIIKRK